MEKNEIKKMLYKQNPVAKFYRIRKNIAYFKTVVRSEDTIPQSFHIDFEIPVIDMGDADFLNEMDSKFLIRWLV